MKRAVHLLCVKLHCVINHVFKLNRGLAVEGGRNPVQKTDLLLPPRDPTHSSFARAPVPVIAFFVDS
jgi:hypothetical protein